MPDGVTINGVEHRRVVLLVHSRDRHDRPKLLTIIHADETVELAGGEEFITAYVRATATARV
jgi:hypothetical protein